MRFKSKKSINDVGKFLVNVVALATAAFELANSFEVAKAKKI